MVPSEMFFTPSLVRSLCAEAKMSENTDGDTARSPVPVKYWRVAL